MEGTKTLIGVTHKAPIILDEYTPVIIFPTHSPRTKECGWINNNMVRNVSKDGYKSKIEFTNGLALVFDISNGSLNGQVLRASRLTIVLKNRREERTKQNSY